MDRDVLILLHHALEQDRQTIGIRVGKRPHQNRVQHREDRGVGADAQSERDDRDEGETGRAAEQTHAVSHILREPFEPLPAPHLACGLRDKADVAELAPRRRLGLLGGLPALQAVADRPPQVVLDFVVEIHMATPRRPAKFWAGNRGSISSRWFGSWSITT